MSADNQLKNRSIGDKIISITAPAFNEAESLEELCKRIRISIEKITEATRIKQLVEKVTKGDCGCNKRKDKLNKMFPYDK